MSRVLPLVMAAVLVAYFLIGAVWTACRIAWALVTVPLALARIAIFGAHD